MRKKAFKVSHPLDTGGHPGYDWGMHFTQEPFLRRHWTLFSIGVLAAGLIWMGLTAWMSPAGTQGLVPAPKEGFLAPDFQLTGLDGKSYTLADFKGRAVVLNIWATWCAFCDSEMPAFQAAANTYSASGGLAVLAVNSTLQDSEPAVSVFVQKHGLTLPVLLDTSGKVTRLYQVQALPTTYFIDRQGIIQNVIIGGPLTEASLRAKIDPLLKGAP